MSDGVVDPVATGGPGGGPAGGPGRDAVPVDAATSAALAAAAGDRAAATRWVELTRDDVWRTCRYLGPSGAADDLAQETYTRAFAGLSRFAGRSSARTWLLAIARNVCADAVAAAVRERGRPVRTPDVSPDHAERVLLDQLLGVLSPERREAFVLTQLLGYGYAEAAQVCRCPVGTIRSRVARARDDLRAAVDVSGRPPAPPAAGRSAGPA